MPDLQKPILNYSIHVKFLEKDKNSYKQRSTEAGQYLLGTGAGVGFGGLLRYSMCWDI